MARGLESLVFSGVRQILYALAEDRTSTIAARPTLIVAPHPDDETLGCGATIIALLATGQRVRVVMMSDGGGSHSCRHINRGELVAQRRIETLVACQRLGLNNEHVIFLDFPDGEVLSHSGAAGEALLRELEAFAPEQILYPSGADAHPDHVAVAMLVEKAIARRAHISAYAYPVWFWKFRPWLGVAHMARVLSGVRLVRVATEGALGIKRHALEAHQSQIVRTTDDEAWGAIPESFLRHFFGRYEIFFEYRPAFTSNLDLDLG